MSIERPEDPKIVMCPFCKGKGRGVHPKAGEWLCSVCNGYGLLPHDHPRIRS